jgi:hypothetical protein
METLSSIYPAKSISDLRAKNTILLASHFRFVPAPEQAIAAEKLYARLADLANQAPVDSEADQLRAQIAAIENEIAELHRAIGIPLEDAAAKLNELTAKLELLKSRLRLVEGQSQSEDSQHSERGRDLLSEVRGLLADVIDSSVSAHRTYLLNVARRYLPNPGPAEGLAGFFGCFPINIRRGRALRDGSEGLGFDAAKALLRQVADGEDIFVFP